MNNFRFQICSRPLNDPQDSKRISIRRLRRHPRILFPLLCPVSSLHAVQKLPGRTFPPEKEDPLSPLPPFRFPTPALPPCVLQVHHVQHQHPPRLQPPMNHAPHVRTTTSTSPPRPRRRPPLLIAKEHWS